MPGSAPLVRLPSCSWRSRRCSTHGDPVLRDVAGSSSAAVVFAIVSFGFQIYFDFNGYSEMARGVSRVLGIELMKNFRAPYTSVSFREFWTRWHISLSEWLRDYVYISLGGNRVRFGLRLRNLLVTMVLGGIWHGAGWNFAIWGGLQGLYLCANTAVDTYCGRRLERWIPRLLRVAVGWSATFVGVMYAWLYFRMATLDDAMVVNRRIFDWLRSPELPPVAWGAVGLVAVLMVVDVWQRSRPDLVGVVTLSARRAAAYGALAASAMVVGVVLLVGAPTQQFVYFQF